MKIYLGVLYLKKDGLKISNTDNRASDYIIYSLKKMGLKISDLKDKKVFNIGTGREKFFANKNAHVMHVDISQENVSYLKNGQRKIKKISKVLQVILKILK